jgi:DNA-binding ferritin-like protein
MSQSDDTQGLSPVRIDIPLEIRLYVIQLLQQTLACTLDLRSQLKQACWNVKGHDLVLLHALFATMATELDAHTDLVAERLVVLGGVARGTVRTAATHSRLPEYPGAIMDRIFTCANFLHLIVNKSVKCDFLKEPSGYKPLTTKKSNTYTHGGELCIIFLTTLVDRPLNAALLGACSTEMMQDYPLHVSEVELFRSSVRRIFVRMPRFWHE